MSSQFGASFEFLAWQFSPETGQLRLNYQDNQFGAFTEVFVFPDVDLNRYQQVQKPLAVAFNCLHWMAGVSYYKTSLAKKITFKHQSPNQQQAHWLQQTWQSGLAELAHENKLSWLEHITFRGDDEVSNSETLNLRPRSLVAIGGGKDSLVSIEMLKDLAENATLFVVGQSAFIQSVASKTGLELIQVKRQVDSQLKVANEQGAFNGHIPITAINSCVAVVAALLFDFDSVVFSNERSADAGNVIDAQGRSINHQYSKSLEFEQTWQRIIQHDIAADLDYFSLLRPFSELAVVQKFSHLTEYFPYFSSCNRNFHLAGSKNHDHHWCEECPKCAFVFLCMAPFVSKQQLFSIFSEDLLGLEKLHDLFAELLGVQGIKPFECVGEEQECRLAMQLLSQHPEWQNHPAVLSWVKQFPVLDDSAVTQIMRASKRHQIPNKRQFLKVLEHEIG